VTAAAAFDGPPGSSHPVPAQLVLDRSHRHGPSARFHQGNRDRTAA